MRKVSVILPVYNEAKCIEKTLKSIFRFAKNRPNFNFIFVNDGSTDKTKEILSKKLESAKTTNVKFISYEFNKGKGYAVKTGVKYADGDYICYMDSDLAYSLEHLDIIVEKLEYFDIVIGCRNLASSHIKGLSLMRKIAGKVFNLLSRIILDLPFSDMQAGIKGFKKDVAKELFKRQQIRGFSFDVELIYVAYKEGYDIGEIPVRVSAQHLYKKSKVNLFEDSIKMFFNLLQIRYKYMKGRYESKCFIKF
ncbi:MAG: glycosyltransferase [Stigonema ocellatum SAG 48.90 = DSM 106950]|nr:glycosyltransferase [Stigonema ocellatum SAG 48.90 = DSM 106950]